MAIAFDASSGNTLAGASSPATLSHTVGAGSNRLLYVFVYGGSATTDIVSGVTYNGVSMTRAPNGFYSIAPGTNAVAWAYYLANPATGTANISVSFTGTMSGTIKGLSYSGCSQSGIPDSDNGGGGTYPASSPGSISTTVVASNCWLIGVVNGGQGNQFAGDGSPNTSRDTQGNQTASGDSNGTVATGSRSLGWTWSGTQNTGYYIASIAPVGNTNFTRTPSDSIMNGASRSATVARVWNTSRALADSIMNAASRFATVGKGLARSLSDSIMNAASRFAVLSSIFTPVQHYVGNLADSIMNAKSRFTVLSAYSTALNYATKHAAVVLNYFIKNDPPTDYD